MSVTEPQSTTLKTNRRWYQFSLRSLLIAVTVSCVLMGVNTFPGPNLIDVIEFNPGTGIDGYEYGWPWIYRTEPWKGYQSLTHFFEHVIWSGLIGDIFVGAVIVVVAILAVEALCLVRRRRTK
jgi:hypothetical protein